MDRTHVLVVGDAHTAAVVRSALSPACECELVTSADAAIASLARGRVDVVVAGDELDDGHALDLRDAIRARTPLIPLILVGAAVDTGSAAVFDCIPKPVDGLALSRSVDRAAETRRHRTALDGEDASTRKGAHAVVIGTSPRFVETLDAIDRVAQSAAPVLLVGETGSGKDVLAKRIHALGSRSHRPFVVVNAAALPASLLDSELFGHAAGSFTGASRARRGLISEAEGGTVFLDEIVDLPIELQGRLLRVIETGAIRAVGSDHERIVDVRFIAATQAPLAEAVSQKRFREDLFYRLNILSVRIPPLRERREDIPALVEHFFARALARSPESPVRAIGPEAMTLLVRASWPGNVRELAAVIERLVVFGRNACVEAEDLRTLVDEEEVRESEPHSDAALPTLRELSLRHVEAVLARTHGDKASAAGILGIDVSTLYRWQRRVS